MALKKNIVTKYGLACSECYLVVSQIGYMKGQQSSLVLVGFVNQEARLAGALPIFQDSFVFDLDPSLAMSAVAQAYEAIKLNPEYEDAIDV